MSLLRKEGSHDDISVDISATFFLHMFLHMFFCVNWDKYTLPPVPFYARKTNFTQEGLARAPVIACFPV
ncbi:hypothetical protein PG2010B_1476 [Bifidobacterium animalis subsp. lactis]|nr:hypothetical protein PG2007B_1533 [Bifidobacterium animalis subsp. lactis]RYM91399.1 hypothetical protein PG2010B_1476 [Bifidobacterium animalis subsp. lactis]RYN06361.1 hypothetical protein PG1528B_1449 [Bifidobacterium animalis subsp. lactis]